MTFDDKAFLKLICRSPDTGEGWRNVSAPLWKFVTGFPHQDLIESEAKENGGRVRLSSEGEIFTKYMD